MAWFNPVSHLERPNKATAMLYVALPFIALVLLMALNGDNWKAYSASSPLILLTVVAAVVMVRRYRRTRPHE